VSSKGFKKFKKNHNDYEDAEYDQRQYTKRKTPRHRPNKEANAIYAEPVVDHKDYRKEYD
jgi:hypothetical protein